MLDLNKIITYRSIDEKAVETKANQLLGSSFERLPDKNFVRYIDYAFLDEKESYRKVESKLLLLKKLYDSQHDFRYASICLYPNHVPLAVQYLKNSDTKIAAVTGNFPTGQTLLRSKLQETRQAIDEGAVEIDYIYVASDISDGNYQKVSDELKAVREVCKGVKLKVILETGGFDNLREVKIASEIALDAGADFIKSSTGKIRTGATITAAYVMLQTVKEYFDETGRKAGVKFSGGISGREQAFHFMHLALEKLGREWIHPASFRIGAGGLAFNILNDAFRPRKEER